MNEILKVEWYEKSFALGISERHLKRTAVNIVSARRAVQAE